jgi:two-component system chemotaxis sensor kinase CheA
MTDEEFLIQLRQAFVVEAQEQLQAITAGLLTLEQNPAAERRQELVEDTFREAHSLKGAARAVGRTDIESLCQEMETIFAAWKERATVITPDQFNVLNCSVNLVGRLIALEATAQSPEDIAAIEALLAELRGQPSSGASSVEPPSPQPPVPAAEIERPQTQTQTQAAETVRVSMAKMDSLLLHAEEMIALKLAAGQHASDLHDLEEAFNAWQVRWARMQNGSRRSRSAQRSARTPELDEFLDWNQEFIVNLGKKVAALARLARHDERTVGSLVDELLANAKKLVMLPCSSVLDLFPKQVRDLANSEGKEVDLVIQGREVELDKRILEEIKAPLIHLVRNAVDHGIETSSNRAAAGKPSRSSLNITVSQAEGNKVLITVSDDGRGIQAAKLRASAVKQGVISAEDASRLSDEASFSLIFQSGLSTSPIVTEVSGRGLGMAIVRDKVAKLGGAISIESRVGQGTTFRILLPVTLATFKGMLVRAGGQTFVIPISSAECIKRFRLDEIKTVEGRETVELNGRAIAFVQLAEVLHLPESHSDQSSAYVESVVLGAGDRRIAFGVQAVLNEQEVLVKKLGHPLQRVRNVAAATVLGSGTPVLILNPSDLLNSAVGAATAVAHAAVAMAHADAKASRILVADDSVTSRMLIKNILETSGYNVETATDGLEALNCLRNNQFDLLVSDVEMPRMNGFELTSSVRTDQKLNELPVILVTSLASREHRERGIDAGANAYIVKSSFDQSDLLSVVGKLI